MKQQTLVFLLIFSPIFGSWHSIKQITYNAILSKKTLLFYCRAIVNNPTDKTSKAIFKKLIENEKIDIIQLYPHLRDEEIKFAMQDGVEQAKNHVYKKEEKKSKHLY